MIVKILIGFNIITLSSCARILGLFLIPSESHKIFFQPILEKLASRGHDLTIFTPLIYDFKENITQVDVSYTLETFNNFDIKNDGEINIFTKIYKMFQLFRNSMELIFQRETEKNILKEKNYDVVLVEHASPVAFVPAVLTGAPSIGISSFSGFLHAHDSVGNPTHPVASPSCFLHYESNLSFFERVDSTFFNLWMRFYYFFYEFPKCDKLIKKYFGNNLPYLEDVHNNVSLQIFNNNPITGIVKPNVQNVVEISGVHLKAPKPLPKDLKDFLDNSGNGLIYISSGTNIFVNYQSQKYFNILIKSLEHLPYKILLKFNGDPPKDLPENILIKDWVSQSDVLAHPNVKVFVTQGGIHSIEEAVNSTVPMVGIPVLPDQIQNVKIMVRKGVSLMLDYKSMTVSDLKNAIIEVAQNKKFKKKIKKLRILLKDQPMTGVDKAVWYIEYIIRRKGAPHLRSTAVNMPLYQYYMLDILSIILGVLSAIILAVYCLIKLILRIRFIRIKLKVK